MMFNHHVFIQPGFAELTYAEMTYIEISGPPGCNHKGAPQWELPT